MYKRPVNTSTRTEAAATRVFVVEDSAILRVRLVELLTAIPTATLIGYAETSSEAIHQIGALRPDVVLLDIKLKNSSGMEVLQALKVRFPAITVIMLTNHASPEYREQYLSSGAHFFLDKTNEFQNIALIGLVEEITRARRQVALTILGVA